VSSPELSVVVPVFNEERLVGSAARELADALEAAFGAGLSPVLRQRASSLKDPWEEEEASTRK
jgi:hypothetical protein